MRCADRVGQQRLEARGASPTRGSASVSVLDDASRVLITVRVAEPEAAAAPVALVTPNTVGAIVRVNERAPAVFGAPRPQQLSDRFRSAAFIPDRGVDTGNFSSWSP